MPVTVLRVGNGPDCARLIGSPPPPQSVSEVYARFARFFFSVERMRLSKFDHVYFKPFPVLAHFVYNIT